MRICYCGPRARQAPGRDLELTEDGAHGCNAIGHDLCHAWNELGYEASIWNYWKAGDDGTPTHEMYDAVFLYDHSMAPLWAEQVPDWEWDRKLTIYYSHLPPARDRWSRRCHLVGYIHAGMAAAAEQFRGEFRSDVQIFALPWAAPGNWELPPPNPDPYTHERKVAVWAGRLSPVNVGPLVALAEAMPELELHIFSNTLDKQHLTREQLPTGPHVHFHGSAKHGTFQNYLWYADVSLDAMIDPRQTLVNSKQPDYLLAGVPMVAEGPVPGDEYLRATGLGIIVPYSRTNYAPYIAAVRNVLARNDWPRRAASAYMQGCHTWRHRGYAVHQQIRLWREKYAR